jgi:hypothetical protein
MSSRWRPSLRDRYPSVGADPSLDLAGAMPVLEEAA